MADFNALDEEANDKDHASTMQVQKYISQKK